MLLRLDECPSTQEEARKLAAEGAPHGAVVVARHQTAGRGRQGRTWQSVGEALTFSMVVRPAQLPAVHAPRLTLTAGVAILRALPELPLQLKWPNDVYADGRKVGGILVEALQVTRTVGVAILGVGLNVEGHPEDVPSTDLRSLGYAGSAEELLDTLRAHLPGDVHDFARTLQVARERSATLHRNITTSDGDTGRAVDLDDEGALILDTAQGRKILRAGEIRHLTD